LHLHPHQTPDLIIDEDFEGDSSGSVGEFALFDVFHVNRLAGDLDENSLNRPLHLDEDQRAQIFLLSDEGPIRQVDGAMLRAGAVRAEVLQRSDVVFVGGVLAFAFELEGSGSVVDFRKELVDLVDFDGEARSAVFVAVVGVDAVVHNFRHSVHFEGAWERGVGDVGRQGTHFAILMSGCRLAFEVCEVRSFFVEKLLHVIDVWSVGLVIGHGELDHGLILVRSGPEAHAGILRQDRVGAGEQRCIVIREREEEDAQKTREKGG